MLSPIISALIKAPDRSPIHEPIFYWIPLECDWGDCENVAVTRRWSEEGNMYLPVCMNCKHKS